MDLILHHYEASPFSEKVRLMLGLKGLAWTSVLTPSILPKPDLTALTGGYRRAPVLQVGADVYCDTARIARLLDERQPEPALAHRDALAADTLAHWCDQSLFFLCIMRVIQPDAVAHFAKALPANEAAGFAADRAQFMQGATVRPPSPAEGLPELALALRRIEQQLSDGRAYLLGSQPCVADLAAYHPLWVLARNPATAPLLAPFTSLGSWLERIAALGPGTRVEQTGEWAVEVARSQAPLTIEKPAGELLEGVALGDAARVSATDYGREPTRGVLVHADLDEIALRRTDPRAGEVVVHFPRSGFQVQADSA